MRLRSYLKPTNWGQALQEWRVTKFTRKHGGASRDIGSGLVLLDELDPNISGQGTVNIGQGTTFRATFRKAVLHAGPSGSVTIGSEGYFDGTLINSEAGIYIGSRCLCAEGVVISDTNSHEVSEGEGIKAQSIHIGDNVWIGLRAIILPGVTIGDHCVIGAGSVVTKSIPARSLAAGNPCRVIRPIQASERWRRS